MQHDIIGAVLPAAPRPVWLRAVMVREGDDVVTRCCIVADGELFPIEVRVNVPELIRTAKALGLDRTQRDTVGGFGSFLKKAVKSITKNKLVRSVGKIASKVVNNPVVQLANPIAAIAVHTTKKAVTGTGTIKGAAGKLVDAGASVTTKLIPSPLAFISPKATAALGVGLKTVGIAKAGAVVSSVAKAAQSQVNLGKAAASALKQSGSNLSKSVLQAQVKKAVQVRQTVERNAPALAKKVQDAAKVKASIASIAEKAKAGSAEAREAAKVIAKSASAIDRIQSLTAQAGGGLPGLVITADGRIVRAPKGRFQLRTTTAPRGQAQVLYRGPRDPVLRGIFTAVSGGVPERYDQDPAWGGHQDPGDELDGPLSPVRYSESWELDDYSALPGNWVGALTP